QQRLLLPAAAVIVALTVVPRMATAQSGGPSRATNTAGKTWTVPRTPWGDPDLQGLWPSSDMQGTPYERPAQFGDRPTLSQQELAERQTQSTRQAEADAETVVNTQRTRGTGIGAPSHWGERGKPSGQASLIVDPP